MRHPHEEDVFAIPHTGNVKCYLELPALNKKTSPQIWKILTHIIFASEEFVLLKIQPRA